MRWLDCKPAIQCLFPDHAQRPPSVCPAHCLHLSCCTRPPFAIQYLTMSQAQQGKTKLSCHFICLATSPYAPLSPQDLLLGL